MKRILIFTAGFGEGHNTAARNICDAIEHIAPDEARVEVIDLFDECYGRLNDIMRKAYLTAINRAPKVWGKIYDLLDTKGVVESNLALFNRMKRAMADLLQRAEPDAVVSTYPMYNYVIEEALADQPAPTFPQITVVTDSITINSVWHRSPSDYFLVPNEPTAEAMRRAGVPEEKLRVFGFPVTHRFADPLLSARRSLPARGEPRKVLYLINSGRKEAHRVALRLAKLKDVELTVTAGRNPSLRRRVERAITAAGRDANVLGWTSRMPELLMSHHVVVSKAGGATVQEAIAARCPMVISQVVPGQEEGNARLLLESNAAICATGPSAIAEQVESLFADGAARWRELHENISKLSRPSASLDIARFILETATPGHSPSRNTKQHPTLPDRNTAPRRPRGPKGLLLCDFHTHTNYSDGKLTIPELVTFYGQRGFDVLCVTDHYCDPKKLIGKIVNLTGLVLLPEQIAEYFQVLETERRRALDKYGMILMTGLEFNKDGVRKKSSAHLLGIDLREPIDPSLSILDTIGAIHAQGGLAVAAHPHEFKTSWGKDTLHFWENMDLYSPLLDAWEIANRDEIFNPVGLKKLPFIANSDFHKPRHIYSWKTMLYCEKDPEAIKECIRTNRDIAITLYRDHHMGALTNLSADALESRHHADNVTVFPKATSSYDDTPQILSPSEPVRQQTSR